MSDLLPHWWQKLITSDVISSESLSSKTKFLPINKFSILEPKNKDKVIFPKIILIPLLGYSKSGFRLGYGGGYYDKYLSKNGIGDVKKIGIAFSFQEVEEIPVEDHDERLDWILTEKHLYKVQWEFYF